PPRGRTKGGPITQTRRGIAPRAGSRGEEQRTAGDGLPGGIANALPTAPEDAGIAETNAGRRIRITISQNGGGGPSQVPPTGREPRGLSQQTASSGRGAGYRRATADSPITGQGSPGGKRHDYAAPFDPDSTIRAKVKRIPGSVCRRHPTNAEPRLSFAFGESCLHLE